MNSVVPGTEYYQPVGYSAPKLIGISGSAGVGKSTAAQYLSQQHGFVHLKFAGALKAMLRTLLALTGEAEIDRLIEGDLKEMPPPALGFRTPRHAMQTLGTEWGRDCMGENFWVDICKQQIQREIMLEQNSVVVDDVRFENEAAMIRSLGGKVIRLTGRGGIKQGHISEAGVRGDLHFINDRSMQDFHNFLASVVESH